MITLDLTNEQAKVLLTVLYRVGGPQNSLRIYTEDIVAALADAGIDTPYPDFVIDDRISGQIYFAGDGDSRLSDDEAARIRSIHNSN